MKETTRTSRTAGQLEKMFRTINRDKFNNELPEPIITISPTRGAYGHFTPWHTWKVSGNGKHEINLSSDQLERPIECIVSTLIHEMVHLYCYVNDIKDTSRGGTYHNRRFAAIAAEKGLEVQFDSTIGCTTNNEGNERLIEYCLDNGWTEFKMNRKPEIQTSRATGTAAKMLPPSGGQATTGTATKKSHSIKYQCPRCKNSVRATKKVNIACMNCIEVMYES